MVLVNPEKEVGVCLDKVHDSATRTGWTLEAQAQMRVSQFRLVGF